MEKWTTKLFEIDILGELPALNEIIAANKGHYGQYAKMKRANGGVIKWRLKQKQKSTTPIEDKVDVKITWWSKTKRKDPDNVDAGIKFILDAFVEYGVLVNDTRKYIGDIYHVHKVDKDKPRCKVELFEFKEVE